MASAVVALFDQYEEAQSTVNELLVSGFDREEVKLNAEEGPQLEREEAQTGGVKGFFQDLFGKGKEDDDQIRMYDEAVRHGNYVVSAIASTEERSDLASEVMNHHHPIGEQVQGGGVRVFKNVYEVPVETAKRTDVTVDPAADDDA
jgi:hypothetical protein